MLSVYHSPIQLFSRVYFSPLSLRQLEWLAKLQQSLFHCNFCFLMWSLLLMLHPLIGPFIFRDLGLPLSVSGTWSGFLV